MKTKITIILLGLISHCCQSLKINQEDNVKSKTLIIENRGFKNIVIDSTTIKDVIKKYGKNYVEIEYGEYSYNTEIKYKELGLSFWFETGDSSKTISAIDFYFPFKGITSRGIELNKSKMSDVKLAHDTLDWYTTNTSPFWFSEHVGIEYAVERDTILPRYPLDEKLHTTKKIIKIGVLNNREELEENEY